MVTATALKRACVMCPDLAAAAMAVASVRSSLRPPQLKPCFFPEGGSRSQSVVESAGRSSAERRNRRHVARISPGFLYFRRVWLYSRGIRFGFEAVDARRAPFTSMTPFQGSSAWGRSAVPGLRPGLSYLAPLGLGTFFTAKPRRGDISSALGNARGPSETNNQSSERAQ